MRKAGNVKVILLILMVLWVVAARLLTGCSMGKDTEEKVRDLEISVVGDAKFRKNFGTSSQKRESTAI